MNLDEREAFGIQPGRGKVAGILPTRLSAEEMYVAFGRNEDREREAAARRDDRASKPKRTSAESRRNNKRMNGNAARLFATLRRSDPALGNGTPNGNAAITPSAPYGRKGKRPANAFKADY